MAEITGIFAVSHAPPLVRDWNTIEAGRRQRMDDAFRNVGRLIAESKPDVIVAIGPDHWANFFLDNMPAMCLGVGVSHAGSPEPWMSDFPHKTMAGHPALGMHLARHAFRSGFEPSLSHQLCLDHGFSVPIVRAKIDPLPPIVPIIINCIQEPGLSVARCLAFGSVLADGIRSFDAPCRVVILATGGLSHSVGEPTMGLIDEAFDRDCLRLLAQGGGAALEAYLTDERMARAGNGSSELRYWTVAHAAAGLEGFDLLYYEAVPDVMIGCGLARWHLPAH